MKPYETVSILSTVAKKEGHPNGWPFFGMVFQPMGFEQLNAGGGAFDRAVQPCYPAFSRLSRREITAPSVSGLGDRYNPVPTRDAL